MLVKGTGFKQGTSKKFTGLIRSLGYRTPGRNGLQVAGKFSNKTIRRGGTIGGGGYDFHVMKTSRFKFEWKLQILYL
ncbi:MAG: hypothetical protein CMP20_17645 [Rickettsiales bacterium]|nr:hypothetical protein [Rickettsiales bacterium]